MKERHIRLRLSQGTRGTACNAVGWNLAAKTQTLAIEENCMIDVAYKLREDDSAFSGGMELELLDLRRADDNADSVK